MVYRRRAVPKSMVRRRKARRSVRKSTVSRRVRAYVQKAINVSSETKHAMLQTNPTNFNGVSNVAGDLIPIIPVIANGDGSYQKEGEKIRMKSLITKGIIKWQPNTFAEDTVYACIWSVEDKLQKNFAYTVANTPSATYPNDMFYCLLDGFNEPALPTGDWNEIGYRFNTKRFKVTRKIIRLTPNYPSQSTTTPAVASEGVGESMRMFTFKRYFGKKGRTLKYPTFTSSYPENYNAYMFVSFFGNNAPGGYSSLSNIQVSLAATHVLSYED